MSSLQIFSLLSSPAHGHFEIDPLWPQLKLIVTAWVLAMITKIAAHGYVSTVTGTTTNGVITPQRP